jgi:hypothetical protein
MRRRASYLVLLALPAAVGWPSRVVAAPTSGPAPLQGEAGSAATGDIPDNQVFLTFRNVRTGYSMRYPEGWAQKGSAAMVVFQDKNNIVRIVVGSAHPPSRTSVRRELAHLRAVRLVQAPRPIALPGGRALVAVYSTRSVPNAVTGKRVTLVVNRYYLWKGGRVAVVDLGTPRGVDNVDAYRLMIESFRWR